MEDHSVSYVIIIFLVIVILLVIPALIWGNGENSITNLKKQLEGCKEGEGIYRLEVECIKYDNDGWMNTTTITTHIHSFKYYQTYSDYKEMVEGYEECEVQE